VALPLVTWPISYLFKNSIFIFEIADWVTKFNLYLFLALCHFLFVLKKIADWVTKFNFKEFLAILAFLAYDPVMISRGHTREVCARLREVRKMLPRANSSA